MDPAIAAGPSRQGDRVSTRGAGLRRHDRNEAPDEKVNKRRKPSLMERAVAPATARGEGRTKELANIGVHRCRLARMCDEGLLVKVGTGDIALHDEFEEDPALSSS